MNQSSIISAFNLFRHPKKIPDSNLKYVLWDALNQGEWAKEIEGAHLVVNLCGKTVNCRYTEKNKKEIFHCRTQSTNALGEAIPKSIDPPKLWINASSATIYRHSTDRSQDEYNGEIANDFSVQVCKLWEKTFFDVRTPFTRKVALRMAVTLGSAGVIVPYFYLLKFGLGGHQGSGKQMYSWVHIQDTGRIIEWIDEHTQMEGVYNCCSTNPVANPAFYENASKSNRHQIWTTCIFLDVENWSGYYRNRNRIVIEKPLGVANEAIGNRLYIQV